MKFVLYTICYLLYPFSFLFPRRGNRYAFGSYSGGFADNAKYLFLYVSRYVDGVEVAWVSPSRATVRRVRAMGLKAYCVFSPHGAWHALTSKYWFFNSYTSDIFYSFSGRAVCFNLWHGLALKRIEYNIEQGLLGERYRRTNIKEVYYHPQSFRAPDYVLSSTPFQTQGFAKAFRIAEERCLEFGYPRNEILTAEEAERSAFLRRFEPESVATLVESMKGYSRVYIYMPTWRDSQREIFVQSMDLNRLNAAMRDREELFVLKPHANVKVEGAMLEYSNLLFLDGEVDVYPLLPYTDVLVTDYSSVLYDYVLMKGKDVILYLYDYEEYLAERDLFYPFDENVVGRRAYSFEELLDVINRHDFALEEADRARLVDKFWGITEHYDSNRMILDFVKQLEV